MDSQDGKELCSTPLHPEMTDKYGFPYWLIHRSDYHSVLRREALAEGVRIHVNSRVISIDENLPSATIQSGETYHGDLIIGADGSKYTIL